MKVNKLHSNRMSISVTVTGNIVERYGRISQNQPESYGKA